MEQIGREREKERETERETQKTLGGSDSGRGWVREKKGEWEETEIWGESEKNREKESEGGQTQG